MTEVFADTSYYLALLLRNDRAHARAIEATRRLSSLILTTAWIVTEVGNALSSPPHRPLFVRLKEALRSRGESQVIEPSQALFEKGIALYRSRLDKGWSLTDCISFVVMREHGVVEALTGDRHFVQAGFNALLIV